MALVPTCGLGARCKATWPQRWQRRVALALLHPMISQVLASPAGVSSCDVAPNLLSCGRMWMAGDSAAVSACFRQYFVRCRGSHNNEPSLHTAEQCSAASRCFACLCVSSYKTVHNLPDAHLWRQGATAMLADWAEQTPSRSQLTASLPTRTSTWRCHVLASRLTVQSVSL